MKGTCPTCGHTGDFDESPVSSKVGCPRCGRMFNRSEVKPKKTRRGNKRKTTRGRSSRQESFNAKRVGGRLTLNSGAMDDKGDIKVPDLLRDENKTTAGRSFTLKLDDLDKVAAAAKGDEMPVMTIAFEDDLKKQFRVLRHEDFLYLLELEKNRRG